MESQGEFKVTVTVSKEVKPFTLVYNYNEIARDQKLSMNGKTMHPSAREKSDRLKSLEAVFSLTSEHTDFVFATINNRHPTLTA